MSDKKPLVGSFVHYFESSVVGPLAAIITDVGTDGIVNMAVFGKNGIAGNATSIPYGATYGTAGRWSWPDQAPAPKAPRNFGE